MDLMKINVYKRGIGIINDDHQQNENHRRSSTRKSSMCGMNINMGNVNHQQWSSPNGNHRIVGGMLVVNIGCEEMLGLTLPWRSHVLFNTFPKIYTKFMNPPRPPRGNTGVRGINIVKNIKKHLSSWVIFRIFPICIREHITRNG